MIKNEKRTNRTVNEWFYDILSKLTMKPWNKTVKFKQKKVVFLNHL